MLGLKVGTDGQVEGQKSAMTDNNIDATNSTRRPTPACRTTSARGRTHQNNDGDRHDDDEESRGVEEVGGSLFLAL